ncbi:glucose-6-phosphate dehydrogenase [Cohnella thermotolerans]|uniref:glucose-6-phosphate dehydrogenase n=1 Tax=Cohnella thermotolerans TaxID=329858 RepID=UPI00041C1BE4|nr:glucose-6-phosphate dehydrogenase [Cohnella thermotolerans]
MESMTFVLFGATGDLAKRKIFPALYNLHLEGKLPSTFSVVGLGRREWTDEAFQSHVEKSLNEFSRRPASPGTATAAFLSAFRYQTLDVNRTEDYVKLLHLVRQRESELNIPDNRLFYLSVGPDLFDVIASNIKESGLGDTAGWKRLVIEKPFGHDLESARQLNAKLSKAFEEDEIFRIDHYLGKTMVQNLETFVLANPVIQAVWNNRHIANVQITASETVGVEERAGYYDQSGAIRDMVQNHMLQMLMMTAMRLPKQITAAEIRNEKRKIMASLRPIPRSEVAANVVRGQYASGAIQGKPVPAYLEEPGIPASSRNDTFVAARLWIDDPEWKGVPFYIRTGKRMAAKSTRIVVEFKNPTEHLYASRGESTPPNLLVIEINPNEKVTFLLNGKNALNAGHIDTLQMDSHTAQQAVPEAYERLIFDALQGDATFFAHWNEVEMSWQWVQPILEAFEADELPLHLYEAGSNGPEASDRLLEQDGHRWLLDPETAQAKQAQLV